MDFIDTHVHLQDFNADFAPPVLAAPEAQKLVLIAAQETDFDKIARLLQRYPERLNAAFGIHPWYEAGERDFASLKRCLQMFPQALVGEIGVDALRQPPTAAQHQSFSAQLDIARQFNRPVVVHAAKAFEALKEHEGALKNIKFVHHGFVKNIELLRFINRCGGYIGLGALFLKQEKAAQFLAEMPQDKILFETDAPYRVNDSGYLTAVQENLRALASIAGQPVEELAARLITNAKEFMKC